MHTLYTILMLFIREERNNGEHKYNERYHEFSQKNTLAITQK